MFKKVLFAVLVFSFSISYGYAGTNPHQSPSDTTDTQKKDSLFHPDLRVDPKEGFKDLFINTPVSNGVSVERLNPLAIGFVEDYMLKFGKNMEEMRDWGKPYFDMMDAILVRHGLPKELKYLAVIESQLRSQARSWAGAVGPWQFMAGTARTMGLLVNHKIDERRDLYKSTHAAARYLVSLYSLYGDWLLVIAAYNGGPGKVNSAIKKSGSRDFWALQKYLPAESRNHVKKFIATHYIMEGEGGITTLTKKETGLYMASAGNTMDNRPALDSNTRSQPISGRYHSSIITKYIQMDLTVFNQINPDFDRVIADNGKYELRLPVDKMELFLARKPDILSESLQFLLNPDYAGQASTR